MKRKLKNRRRAGFTLAELLVVIGVIVVSLSIVLPTVHALFTAGAETQAIAAMSAALGAARGCAIEQKTYALLHVQPHWKDEKCYAAVFKYDSTKDPPGFVPPLGYRPWQMPGGIAFGEVTARYITVDTDMMDDYDNDVLYEDGEPRNFCTFNVVFAPNGSLTEYVHGKVPQFLIANAPLFEPPEDKDGRKLWDQKLWDWDPDNVSINEKGIRMMTVFDYERLKLVPNRADELNESGRFLVVNPYTGQLLPSE
jgi:prepilin-type N-terminal cleavage/methylation domain-containing protein